MRYALMLVFLIGMHCGSVYAQTDTTEAPSKKVTFTIGALYTNNANYYGQTAEKAMPYVATAANVQFRSGFYLTGTAYRLLSDSGTFVSASSAGAGFDFPIGKKLKADLSYSHTFYPADSRFLQAANSDNASVSLKYKYWMTTGVNADYAFGKRNDMFVTLSTEKQISLGSFAKGKDLITLTPSVDAVAGTQHFYQTYVQERISQLSKLGLPIPILPGVPANSQTVTEESTRFDLLSYNLRVPLAYNRSHYMLQVEYQLSVLSDNALSGAGTNHSFVNCSFYYQF
ncbi:hypothetical protein [Chitinophaga sp. 212800010-3]|uniref:hypothetical protein n=1 Tax=unclassified Chitinophaga TaxID=2619133 RepID=UPI002DEDB068|nr:Outer membrane protein beta-barrel domain-containing protein [Chitinophaga sp. 212800010-3]